MAGLSGGFIAGADLNEVTLDEPSIRSRVALRSHTLSSWRPCHRQNDRKRRKVGSLTARTPHAFCTAVPLREGAYRNNP